MNSCPDLSLDWCSIDAARFACERWHYSRSVPSGKTVKVGVWECQRFIGVVIFSSGSAGVRSIGPTLGLQTIEVAELARVALTAHKNPVTKIVSIAIRLLAKAQPGLKLLVSYADPKEGHIGGIYQGGNWIYTGRSSRDFVYTDRSGKSIHSRSVSESGFKIQFGVKKQCPKPSDLTRQELPPKYRYMYCLSADVRPRVSALGRPYPKRVASDTIDTAAVQAAKGGETPTATLQTSEKAVSTNAAPKQTKKASGKRK